MKRLLLIISALSLAILFIMAASFVWKRDPGGLRYGFSNLRDWKRTIDKAPAVISENKDTPDIFVVVLDTMRFDSLFHDYDISKVNPKLKRVMSKARIFKNGYSTSCWTVPAHASMFTGLYPIVHKSDMENWKFGKKYPFLPEILTEKGYMTVGLTENPNLGTGTGFERGFQIFDDTYRRLFYDKWKTFKSSPRIKITLTPAMIKTMTTHPRYKSAPLFMFVNLIDPHWPYIPMEKNFHDDEIEKSFTEAIEFQQQYTLTTWYLNRVPKDKKSLTLLKKLYDAEIDELAEKIELIIKAVNLRKDRKKIIFFLADHGEQFGEKGHMFHSFSLSNILTKTPFFIIGDNIEPGIVNEPVSLVDLFATIGKLAGVARIENHGVDILGELKNNRTIYMTAAYPKYPLKFFSAKDRADPLMHPYLTPRHAVIKEGWKYEIGLDGKRSLYKIDTDPYEKENLIMDEPGIAESLRKILDKYLEMETDKFRADIKVKVDDKTLESLKALGYIQ